MPRRDAACVTDEPSPAHAGAAAALGGPGSLADSERRLAPYFERAEPRPRAMAYLRGLLSPVERQHSWPWAEVRGDATPYGLQHWLRRARWDPEAVRDERRRDLLDHLGEADAVLVIDATGLLTKGQSSAGVARQYSGTAGRMDHGQMGVCVAYASRHGHARLHRERYLPNAWTDEPSRCREAGMPEARCVATKPQLAKALRQRTLAAGVPARWVTGDRVYGDDRRVRMWWEAQPQAYVLAVSGQAYLWLDWHPRPVNTVVTAWPEDGWSRLSAGDGSTGPRSYDWRGVPLAEPVEPGGGRWLLVRRRMSAPQARQAYVVFAPQDTTLAAVVRVAGTRWTLERGFDAAKSEVGLDQYAVRSWTGWYRHITLAMWAVALLTVLRAGAIAVDALKKRLPPLQERRSLAAFQASRGRRSP